MQKRKTFLLLFCAAIAIFLLGQTSPAYASGYYGDESMIDIQEYYGDITSVSHSGDEDSLFGHNMNKRPITCLISCPAEVAELIFYPERDTGPYEYSTDGNTFQSLPEGIPVSILQGILVRPTKTEPGEDPDESTGADPDGDPGGNTGEDPGEETGGEPQEDPGEEPQEEFVFTFMALSGGILSEIRVAENAFLTQIPVPPAVALHTFRYWTEEGEAVDFSAFPATRHAVFAPYYEKTSARVTFCCGGLTSTDDVLLGIKVLPPPLFAPPGYTVVWRHTPEGPAYDFDAPVTEDITLQASYEPRTYIVRFLLGEGQPADGTPPEQTIPYLGSATAPTVTPPPGKRFAGWDISYSCVTADLEVRARYAQLKYTVTFFFTSQSSLQVEVEFGQKVSPPDPDTFETPLPEGMNLAGWREAGSANYFDFDSQIMENKFLNAVFERIRLNVRYFDGYSEIKDEGYLSSVPYGDLLPVPPPPEKTGLLFEAWCITQDLTTPYNFYLPVKTAITLYARFSPARYTVTTELSAGIDCTLSAGECCAGEMVTFSYTLPEGYLLAEKKIRDKEAEWTLDENCFYVPNSDVTLCLILAEEKYSLAVNVCGTETTVQYGEHYEPGAPELQEHEVFLGWYLDEALTQQYEGSIKAAYGQTVYLYPQIMNETFDIVFVYGYGGSITLYTPTYYNELPVPPQISTQAYLRFDGWDKEIIAAVAPATYTAHYTLLFDRYFYDEDLLITKEERQALSAPSPAAPQEKEGMAFDAYLLISVDTQTHEAVYRASYSLVPADDTPVNPLPSDEPGLTPDDTQPDGGVIYKESPLIDFKFDAEDPFLLILFCAALALASVAVTMRYFFRKRESLIQK